MKNRFACVKQPSSTCNLPRASSNKTKRENVGFVTKKECFSSELDCLLKQKCVVCKNNILKLCPFLYKKLIIRVSGRPNTGYFSVFVCFKRKAIHLELVFN